MALSRALAQAAVALTLLAGVPAAAQTGPDLPMTPPARFTPDPDAAPEPPPASGDTWIFSGILEETHETFSGTLITGGADTEFELKLADGATCDGGDLHPSLGLVRLSEITCTDDRRMRALFVPEGHEVLKVFGHVGDARFATIAHLLGTKAIPEPSQTAAPHAPPPTPPAPPAATPYHAQPGDDPG